MSCITAPPGDEAGRLAWHPDRHRRTKNFIQQKSYQVITCESQEEFVARLAREFAPIDVPALAAHYHADGRMLDRKVFLLLITGLWQHVRNGDR